MSPRFQGENLVRNQALVDALAKVAQRLRITPAQLAIAWVLHQGSDIVPLIGARKRTQLEESLKALEIRLDPADLAQIEAAMPKGAVAGDRYPAHGMQSLDSERKSAG
jgi:aryl-alcohol dehydrogenase-like predicted oxidoreductase